MCARVGGRGAAVNYLETLGLGVAFQASPGSQASSRGEAKAHLTLCNPTDCSPPGSSVHGILQARVLEWGAIAFSTLQLKYPKLKERVSSFPEVLFLAC